MTMAGKDLPLPYLPEGHTILYVSADNPFMQEARSYALEHSLDNVVKTGAVVSKDGLVIGRGANGSDYHKTHVCERVRLNIPTGQGYDLCEGCSPKNHAEPRAVTDAQNKGHDTNGADLYLWGHWWACESCWNAIIKGGIKNVYRLEGSQKLFNKSDPDNILGKWA
jgi:deoxycytidylate deaminase